MVFVNGLVAIISKFLVKYQKRYTLVNETTFSFNMIMVIEFVNMGLVILILSFEPSIQNSISGLSSEDQGASQKFNGFEPDWYTQNADKIGFFIFLSFIFSTSVDVLYAIYISLFRLYDRQWKLNIKRDPEDPESDKVNTKL